jgi:RNA recognition motif-containing protein
MPAKSGRHWKYNKRFLFFHQISFYFMNIYVANINFRAKEAELKELFAKYGTVEKVKIVTDRETGKSRGFGFVEIPDNAEATAAIEALNEFEFKERKLVVNEAKEREEKGRR